MSPLRLRLQAGDVLLAQPRNWATSVSVLAIRLEREGQGWRVASKRGALVRAARP